MADSDDEFHCAVDGCDYSHESKNSMYGHSLHVHEDRYAWERDGDGNTESQANAGGAQPTAPTAEAGGDDDELPPPPSEMEVETEPVDTTPTPTDVLERVLETDPKLSDAQAEWLMEWADLEAPLTTSKLRELATELGTNKTTKRRLANRYTSAVNATLQKNPELQQNTEWALFLTKETGQPHYYQQARQQDTRDTPQVTPPPMTNGGMQGQNQQVPQVQPPGQHPQQPPQTGGVNPPGNQPQGHQQVTPNQQQPQQNQQNQQQQDQTDPEIEQLKKTQEAVLDYLANMQQSDDSSDEDATQTLAERLQEVARIQEQMEQLSGGDEEIKQLRQELRQLRKEAAQDAGGGDSPMAAMGEGGGVGALAMLAANDEHDVDPETLSTLAEAMGVTDSEVKIKEMELEKEEQKWDRIADAFESVSDSLGDAAGGAVSTLVKSMAEGEGDSDEEAELTPADIKAMQEGPPQLRAAGGGDQQAQQQSQPDSAYANVGPQQPPQQAQAGQQEPSHLSTADAPGTNEPPRALQEEQEQEEREQHEPEPEPEPQDGEPAHLSGDGPSENQTPHMSVYGDPETNGEPDVPEANGDRPAEPTPADEPAEAEPAVRPVESEEGGD